MKRSTLYITAVIAIGLMVWTFTMRLGHTQAALSKTPRLEAAVKNDTGLTIGSLKGQYVLVNFWDSRNAVSRIAAGEYDRYYRTHPHANMELLSVNTDANRRLFNEIVQNDGLDSLTQHHINDVKAKSLSPGYHPEVGYSSYLLNPSGKLIAVNPSVQRIEEIIKGGY